MRRSIARAFAIPALSVGVMAGAGVAGPAALAATDTGATDTGGTVQHVIPLSRVDQLTAEGITVTAVPSSIQSISTSDQTATLTFTVTGGNGDVRTMTGSVDMSGSLIISTSAGAQVTLDNLKLNLKSGEFTATPAGTRTPVPLLDAQGVTSTTHGHSQTYDASEMAVDPAAASYLDSALNTTAFAAGQNDGSLTANWTI
jgi:hypothetical protein